MDTSIFSLTVQDAANKIIGFKTSLESNDAVNELSLFTDTSDSEVSFRTKVGIISKARKELIDNALKIVSAEIECQIAAIFLFSKDGFLERLGVKGFDRENNLIPDDWYSDEHYEVGESFTGKAAKPLNGDEKYGRTQYFPDFREIELDPDSKQSYEQHIGKISCAIAVPLNRQNKTYGVLRIINKYDLKNKRTLKDSYSAEDITRLHFLATHISKAISDFRKDVQIILFKQLNKLLVQLSYNRDIEHFCRQVVDLLVFNPDTAFKAGILRLFDSSEGDVGRLRVAATSFSGGVTGNRDDTSRELKDGWVGEVFQNKKPIVRQNIRGDREIRKFKNQAWILQNYFEAFGCFPISIKGKPLGTLSLYTGYKYDFSRDDIGFVKAIADSVASYIYGSRLESLEKQMKEAIDNSDSLHSSDEISSLPNVISSVNKPKKTENLDKAIVALDAADIRIGERQAVIKQLKKDTKNLLLELAGVVSEL